MKHEKTNPPTLTTSARNDPHSKYTAACLPPIWGGPPWSGHLQGHRSDAILLCGIFRLPEFLRLTIPPPVTRPFLSFSSLMLTLRLAIPSSFVLVKVLIQTPKRNCTTPDESIRSQNCNQPTQPNSLLLVLAHPRECIRLGQSPSFPFVGFRNSPVGGQIVYRLDT